MQFLKNLLHTLTHRNCIKHMKLIPFESGRSFIIICQDCGAWIGTVSASQNPLYLYGQYKKQRSIVAHHFEKQIQQCELEYKRQKAENLKEWKEIEDSVKEEISSLWSPLSPLGWDCDELDGEEEDYENREE